MDILGIEFDGLPVLGDTSSTRRLSTGRGRAGWNGNSRGRVRGLPVRGDRPRPHALVSKGDAEVVVDVGDLGVEFDGLLVSAMASSTGPRPRESDAQVGVRQRHPWGRAR